MKHRTKYPRPDAEKTLMSRPTNVEVEVDLLHIRNKSNVNFFILCLFCFVCLFVYLFFEEGGVVKSACVDRIYKEFNSGVHFSRTYEGHSFFVSN